MQFLHTTELANPGETNLVNHKKIFALVFFFLKSKTQMVHCIHSQPPPSCIPTLKINNYIRHDVCAFVCVYNCYLIIFIKCRGYRFFLSIVV